jgi:hypothetical protein
MSSPTFAPSPKTALPNPLAADGGPATSMPAMRPPSFQLTANPAVASPKAEKAQASGPVADAPPRDHAADAAAQVREWLMNGDLATLGDYTLTPKFSFKDERLNKAYLYIREKFGLTDAALEETPADKKPAIGDAPGKDPDDVPGWMQQLTQKLTMTYPNAPGLDPFKHNVTPEKNAPGRIWNEDCTMAQRVVEAFYHGWYKQQRANAANPEATPEKITGNVAELFGDVGSSKNNKRAQAIGETPSAIYGWCGPASAFALAISLMRKGFRFKTSKEPKMPKEHKVPNIPIPKEVEKEPFLGYNKNRARMIKMQEEAEAKTKRMNEFEIANAIRLEIGEQGAHFLATWALAGYGKNGKKKMQVTNAELAKRQVGDKSAYTTDLQQGDYISLIMKNSPLSGHIATVIREEKVAPQDPTLGYQPGEAISKIYMVSGNSKNSSVRVEVVTREMPYTEYEWGVFAQAGNGYTNKKQAIKDAERAAAGPGSGKGALMAKLFGKIASSKDLKAKAAKLFPLGYATSAGIEGNWYKPEMRGFLVQAGFTAEDLAAYDKSLNPEAIAKIDEAIKDKDAYKEKWAKEKQISVDRNEKINPKYGQQKQAAPLDPSHAWIVNVVRSSQLDANRIEDEIGAALMDDRTGEVDGGKLKSDILSKYGLEAIPAGYDAHFNKAMAYWEPRGGFK